MHRPLVILVKCWPLLLFTLMFTSFGFFWGVNVVLHSKWLVSSLMLVLITSPLCFFMVLWWIFPHSNSESLWGCSYWNGKGGGVWPMEIKPNCSLARTLVSKIQKKTLNNLTCMFCLCCIAWNLVICIVHSFFTGADKILLIC